MRLGVSYNIFDGEELLEGSIKCIRDHVDFISVVYQQISNFGNASNPRLTDFLNDLKIKGLVNEVYNYKPNIGAGGHQNEINKRNIGLYLSEGANCTHHMSMDSDEYYVVDEFKKMKADIELNDFDSSACQMLTYYHDFETILDPPEDYYVSLIYKIRKGINFTLGNPFPVLIDPTRSMTAGKCVTYNRETIQMHHMTGVRKNYREKLINSSASVNFKDQIDSLVSYFDNWKYPMKALMPGLPPKYYNVIKIKNNFRAK